MSEELILVHHGIKGQRWGVRRFQNEDGTRTPAGLKRDQQREQREKAGSGSLFKANRTEAAQNYREARMKQTISTKENRKEARANRTEAFNKSKADFKANKTVGQKAANVLINGPIGAGLYNNMRASGHSVAYSEGIVVASSLLGGPLGKTALYLMTKKGD